MSTETADPRYVDIDLWPTDIAVEAMLEGQLLAIAALRSQVTAIARAADAAAARLREGGRLVYVGAGTSGRIAVQDGVELTPTFDWPEHRLVFLLAGGPAAMAQSVEGAEDDAVAAQAAVEAEAIAAGDVVIGIAASGTTAFTIAALQAARARGALTIALSNNPDTALLAAAEHPILLDTGSEVVAGSTRMKAGTAQKAALNLLSTAIMLRLGHVYRGLMVNMRVSNQKLERRACGMVAGIAGVDRDAAARALALADNDIRTAVLIAQGTPAAEARAALDRAGGDLRTAIDAARREA